MPPAIDPSARQHIRQRVVTAPATGLCLDFANTRYWRGAAQPSEDLTDFDALIHWLEQVSAVDADTATSLRALQAADLAAAQRLFAQALQARERLYRLFSGLVAGSAADEDAAALVALVAAAPPRQALVLRSGAAGWQVALVTPSVGEVLAPVLWSAADLALAGGRLRLRECANAKCRWLFLDDSKAGTRRWCSMSACGNRAKAQRHFQRHAARNRPPGAAGEPPT